MKVFQILNDDVLIINGKQQYADTVANFKADSGIKTLPVKVIYDDQQRQPVVQQDDKSQEEWPDYPIAEYDGYIDAIDTYLAAKEKREYVPPTLDELKTQALNYQYQQYVAKRDANVVIDNMGFATTSAGQQDWQIALTLMGDSGQYKVYDADGKTAKLTTVTKEQMMKAGEAARAQQLAAYQDFVVVREKVQNCKNADELKPYLPAETA